MRSKNLKKIEINTDSLIAVIIDLRNTLHRFFFVSITISLIVLYVLYDATIGSPIAQVKTRFANALQSTEEILKVNDTLVNNPNLLREFDDFLSPYSAISSAAEQAIVGVESDDPRWLGLDPESRDLARSITDMVPWYQEQVAGYSDVDLRTIPVTNIKDFSDWLIFPEKNLNNRSALKKLKASLLVAEQLGQNMKAPTEWPASFHFHDYVANIELETLKDLIFNVRRTLNPLAVNLAVDRIDRLCTANSISSSDCTPNGIAQILADEPNSLVKDKTDDISITFFPIGLDPEFFLRISSLALITVFFLYAGHERRWRVLINRARKRLNATDEVMSDTFWATTDAFRPKLPNNPLSGEYFQGFVMQILVTCGVLLPLITQVFVFLHGIRENWELEWQMLALFSVATIGTGTLSVVRLRYELTAQKPNNGQT